MPETETTPVSAPVEKNEAPAVNATAGAVSSTAVAKPEADVVDATLPGGEKLLASIGYIGFFCILTLLAKPKSEICQHHGKQGMAVALVFFIATTALLTITLLIGTSAMLYKLTALGYIAWAAVSVMGMMAASAGKKTSLPFFGSVAQKLDW